MNAKARCKLRRKLRRAEQRKQELMICRKVETGLLNCSETVAKAITMPSTKSDIRYSGSVCLPKTYLFSVK